MVETRTPTPDRKDVPEGPVSYEEFMDWADEDTNAEWVDGEIVFLSPISDAHQDIVEFFLALLRHLVEHRGEGWVRSSKFQMKLDVVPSGREPDVVYLSEENRDRMTGTYIDGPADFVLEVVSPESGPRDRGNKYYEYEKAGVPEYWLVDPEREVLTLSRLTNGQYRTVFEGRDGRVESSVIDGFWIKAEWLWDEERPTVLDVLQTWGII